MMVKNLFLFTCLLITIQSIGATNETDTIKYEIAQDDEVLQMIDTLLANRYFNAFGFCDDTIGSLPQDSIPIVEENIIRERVEELNKKTPIDLRYNKHTKAFINLYVNKKRKLSRTVLRLIPLYFPMFEEILDQFEMPLELKYLAIVESALNPSARSRAGAVGLWQFMYRTGKIYNLNVSSYYDERMDPYKATVAACQFMTDLYKLYGDWNLVLAAYNSGPGNVNKAIRRSGGYKDYWKIRPWLPRETRGYVPAFIAVNYMVNYATKHNLYPENNQLFSYHVDTVKLNKAMSFKQLACYIDVSEEELKFYNPQYKLSYVPESKKEKVLCLPVEKIGIFLTNEEAIYADIRRIEKRDSINGKSKAPDLPDLIVHRVRSGEFLGYIANKYHVRVSDLMIWNNLVSTRINPGDRLKIFTKERKATPQRQQKQTVALEQKKNISTNNKFEVHVVRRGDTLWDIAKKYNNVSVNDLKRLNGDLNFKRLKPGMQVKLKQIG